MNSSHISCLLRNICLNKFIITFLLLFDYEEKYARNIVTGEQKHDMKIQHVVCGESTTVYGSGLSIILQKQDAAVNQKCSLQLPVSDQLKLSEQRASKSLLSPGELSIVSHFMCLPLPFSFWRRSRKTYIVFGDQQMITNYTTVYHVFSLLLLVIVSYYR